MCYPYESTDLASVPCPMCKVFKPSGARCPHVKDICYNRSLHPSHDVVHLKNAEVKSFNGCGYCKWGRANPQKSGYLNTGSPGCCRPPGAHEQHLIGAADWPSVSIVHQVPIPVEIKTLLDSLMPKGSSLPIVTLGRSSSAQGKPPLDRRNSCTSSANRSNNDRAQSLTKGRSGGSPLQQSSATLGPSSRPQGTPSSLPNSNHLDQHPTNRRHNSDPPEKSRSSPVRRNIELEGSVSKRSAGGRASFSSIKGSEEPARQSSLSRSASTSSTRDPKPQSSSRSSERIPAPRQTPKKTASTLEDAMAAVEIASNSSSSDSGSSCGSGSLSDATIISDGGFTDYLSDESEAELQRQAEAKAALVAQNQAEELEFKAVRQQLAGIGLHPPKSWNDTSETMPRMQPPLLHAAYVQQVTRG